MKATVQQTKVAEIDGHIIWKLERGLLRRDLYVIDDQPEGFRTLREAVIVASTLPPKRNAP